jgi:hypothetical protein
MWLANFRLVLLTFTMSQATGKSSSYYIGSADRGEGSKVETTDLSLATPKPVYRGWGFDTRYVPRRLR